jgi:hypothetical protein
MREILATIEELDNIAGEKLSYTDEFFLIVDQLLEEMSSEVYRANLKAKLTEIISNETLSGIDKAEMINNLFNDIQRVENLQRKIAEILNSAHSTNITIRETQDILSSHIQNIQEHFTQKPAELFVEFKPQKSAALRSEFALNFGNISKIKKDYKHLLSTKLTSGKTLSQQLDEVENWYANLQGEDLGLWVKLFGFISTVKAHKEEYADTADLQEINPGIYMFMIKRNKKFYDFFIRPDEKMKRQTTKAKEKFLKWLHYNQNTIDFPMIIDGKIWTVPVKIYTYAENVSDKELRFCVNTNILASVFSDYVNIDICEVDYIADAWQEVADSKEAFKKYRLASFEDLPLKFLLTLKQIYTRESTFTAQSGFIGNIQKLKRENLNKHLGNLKERVATHAKKTKTNAEEETLRLLMNAIFDIARKRRWLMSEPELENGVYVFNLNMGYFDKQNIARLLK